MGFRTRATQRSAEPPQSPRQWDFPAAVAFSPPLPARRVDPAVAFPCLSSDQIERVRRAGHERAVDQGEVLFREGDHAYSFYVVLDGAAMVYEDVDCERPLTSEPVGPGQFLGEVGLLLGEAVYATARMEEPGRVLEVAPERFRELMGGDTDLAEVVLAAFTARRGFVSDSASGLQMVGSQTDPDAVRLAEFSRRNYLPFRWLDPAADADEAARVLAKHDRQLDALDGPVVLWGSEMVLDNPTLLELARAVGIGREPDPNSVADLVIVGAGPAGLAAAVYGASEGLDTVILDEMGAGGQASYSSWIENYLGFPAGLSGTELATRATLQARKFGARFVTPHRAAALRRDGDAYAVELADGDAVRARAVVLATGAHYRRLPVDGLRQFEGAGVYYAATEMEARGCRDATAVVVGGGNSAGQAAMFLSERAEVRRAPVVLWADRIGGVFVLVVLALAALTAGLWLWLDPAEMPAHVAALLVVTCPCALGMATPLALAVASGRAARAGIFVKSDQAVQRLTEIDTVVLDKTGTLTEGRMELAEWLGSEAALDLAAALDAHATHPVAHALVRARGVGPEPVSDVEAVAGHGIAGTVGRATVVVGRAAWVEARSAPLPAHWRDALSGWAEAGHTPVAVAVDGAPAAVLAVGDRLRPEAADLIARLRAEGKAVHVLSGDDPSTVAVVARRLGVAGAQGSVAPEAKRQAVAALQARGRVVLMVGDGVNDAAALRQADVGAAVGGGTTAALVAADLFLTRRGVAPLLDALGGAGQAMRTVRRLLALSLGYNVVGAAAAVAGLVTPLVAAAAMPVSSLAVVGLALLQPSFRRSAPDL